MNRVEFQWVPVQAGDKVAFALAVFVDGRPFEELVAERELPFTKLSGERSSAGSYSGLRAWALPNVKDHFFGGPESDLASGPPGRTVLMSCMCGEPACWPLMAKIELDGTNVVWSDFLQPFRTGKRPPRTWDYGDFSFTFNRELYEAALESVNGSKPA